MSARQENLDNCDSFKKGDNPSQMITERLKDYALHTPMAQPMTDKPVEDGPKPLPVLQSLSRNTTGGDSFDGTKVGDNPEQMLSNRV